MTFILGDVLQDAVVSLVDFLNVSHVVRVSLDCCGVSCSQFLQATGIIEVKQVVAVLDGLQVPWE